MSENKFETPEMLARCVPMSRLQSVLGGKWKIMILSRPTGSSGSGS